MTKTSVLEKAYRVYDYICEEDAPWEVENAMAGVVNWLEMEAKKRKPEDAND